MAPFISAEVTATVSLKVIEWPDIDLSLNHSISNTYYDWKLTNQSRIFIEKEMLWNWREQLTLASTIHETIISTSYQNEEQQKQSI